MVFGIPAKQLYSLTLSSSSPDSSSPDSSVLSLCLSHALSALMLRIIANMVSAAVKPSTRPRACARRVDVVAPNVDEGSGFHDVDVMRLEAKRKCPRGLAR